MEFPHSLSKELVFYTNLPHEDLLFDSLLKKPKDLALFFEVASNDEAWCASHEEFIKKCLSWFTEQNFSTSLSKKLYEPIAKFIQKNFIFFKNLLPEDVLIKLNDADRPLNSLLLTHSSKFFRHLLLKKIDDQAAKVLTFPQLSLKDFFPIETYICTGEVSTLRTMGQIEIIELIKRAEGWELPDLSLMGQLTLVKYLTKENVFEMLRLAKQERWERFEHVCLSFINSCEWGFKLTSAFIEELSFEFEDFYESTFICFEQLRPLITTIICSGTLCEQVEFGLVLRNFSTLYGLDISRTPRFSEQFQEIHPQLRSLNLSECPWISKESLKFFYHLTPNLQQLFLQKNVHLNYIFWGELVKFKALKKLHISYCTQLQDSDLALILKGLPSLTELSLNHCTKISERGFIELGKSLPRLLHLNLSRSLISDTALIEIANRCRHLTSLDISGCKQLTDKGMVAMIKYVLSLKTLTISTRDISLAAIEEIKKTTSQLVVKTV